MSLVTISAKTSLAKDFHAVLPYAFYCSLGLTRNRFSFISVVEDLFRRREPLPSMDVVYFIQPTKEKYSFIQNIQSLILFSSVQHCLLRSNENLQFHFCMVYFNRIFCQHAVQSCSCLTCLEGSRYTGSMITICYNLRFYILYPVVQKFELLPLAISKQRNVLIVFFCFLACFNFLVVEHSYFSVHLSQRNL